MKVETIPADSIKVISFSLVNESNKKKENYAVPIEQIREIRNFSEITHVPKERSDGIERDIATPLGVKRERVATPPANGVDIVAIVEGGRV